jgi:hypothetical protein
MLLFGTVAAALTVALWPADPDRPLHTIRKELTQGKTVTLIGPTGPPAWSRWPAGEIAARVLPTEDQTFTVVTGHIALLELLPDPQVESYRFSAKVRQRERIGGAVGLYFGRSRIDTDTTVLNWLAYWVVTDRPAGGPDRARVSLGVRCLETRPVVEFGVAPSDSSLDHDDAPAFGEWRELALEVTPSEIRVFWEGRRIITPNGAPLQVRDVGRRIREIHWKLLQEVGLHADYPDPSFAARAGLGLYFDTCTASFRNVTIKPLDGAD